MEDEKKKRHSSNEYEAYEALRAAETTSNEHIASSQKVETSSECYKDLLSQKKENDIKKGVNWAWVTSEILYYILSV